MSLQRGEVLGYDFNRMVVDFTMSNQGKTVRCAISTAAMDDLEGKHDVKADQRVDQFVREHRESSKGHARRKDRWCCDPTTSSNSPNEASTGWSTEEGVTAVSGGGRDHRKSRKGDWQPPLLN